MLTFLNEIGASFNKENYFDIEPLTKYSWS